MAAIKISLVADVRSFLSSFKKGAESVEDVTDELDDLAKHGDKTAASIVDNYEDIAKAAKDAQKASAKIGDGADDSIHRVTKTTGEFKDEAKQNFGEVASSFSGDMSSAADLVQGTLGGLAASMSGPIGLALGAASIALGLFIADAQAAAEKADELRTKAVDAVSTALDAGIDPSVFITTAEQVKETIRDLDKTKANPKRWFWEEDPSKLEEWEDGLKAIGRPTTDIQKVLAASTPVLKQYTDAVQAQVDVLLARKNAAVLAHSQNLTQDSLDAQTAAIAEYEAGKDVLKNLNEQINLRGEVKSAAERQADAGMNAALAAIQAAEDEKAAIEDLSGAWQDAIADASDYWVTNEEGVSSFDWGAYLADGEKTVADANEFKKQIVTLPPEIAEEAKSVFASQGAAAGLAYITSFKTASAGDQARAIELARANGEASGKANAEGIVKGFGAPVLNVPTTVEPPKQSAWDMFTTSAASIKPKVTPVADTTKATTDIKAVADKKYEAKITAKADTTKASQDLDAVASKSRTATITAATSTSGIDSQLRNYRPPTVYVPAVLVKPGTRQPI
ncbi:hypothetical protein [Microbacterium sp. P5_E9]